MHFLPQSLTELKGHTYTSQIFIRVRAVLTMGIDHRQRRRQLFPRQMMVGYNDIQFACHGRHIIHRSNAAVHGHQELYTTIGNALQGGQIKAIAFLFPMGNIKIHAGPQSPKVMHQQSGGCHAVHVIVPIDHNLFFIIYGLNNPGHSLIHILHPKWVIKILLLRLQKYFRCLPGADTTIP